MYQKYNRRRFISSALAAGAGMSLSTGAFANRKQNKSTISDHPDNAAIPSLEGRKVLFTYGGWEGHEPKKCLELLRPWMEEEGATVEAHDTLDPYTDKALMDSIDLVIQVFTMSSITEDQENGLVEAVQNGTGMAGWHGGMCDAFRQNVKYQFMTGGQWVAHPGGVIDYEVNIVDHHDPVTKGLKDFKMTSEQYFMHVDPNVKVLATTTFNGDHAFWIDGCVMPVMWKKMYGKGRIFYTSLGHKVAHLKTPEALEALHRGIKWAAASKYEEPEKWITPVYKNV